MAAATPHLDNLGASEKKWALGPVFGEKVRFIFAFNDMLVSDGAISRACTAENC
jgi:hypothetical protein